MQTSATLCPTDRVTHWNKHRSYGHGELKSIVPSISERPACKAYVRFDGETADRLVWLDDLKPLQPSSPKLTVCWPLERSGQPVRPGAA